MPKVIAQILFSSKCERGREREREEHGERKKVTLSRSGRG